VLSPPECDEEKNYRTRDLGHPVSTQTLGQQLFVALPGAVEDAVELQAGEAVVGRDTVLVLLGDVEAEEDLAVALVGQILEDPADQRGVLPRQEARELALAGGHGVEDGVAVRVGLAAGELAVVLDGQAAGDLGQEARQLGRLAQLPPAELLQADAEGVLEEILGLGAAVGVAVEDDRYGTAVELDDPLLRAGISRPDARDQVFRPFSALLLIGQTRRPRLGCGRILTRGRSHSS
jgi:hypothetical protein